LIKILNREDIILVIERRTPYHHQTIGIKLCLNKQWQNSQKYKNAPHFYFLTGFVL